MSRRFVKYVRITPRACTLERWLATPVKLSSGDRCKVTLTVHLYVAVTKLVQLSKTIDGSVNTAGEEIR